MRASEGGRGVWLDIMRVGSDIDKLGIEFSSSSLVKGKEHIYHFGEQSLRWVWDWTRTPRGRVVGELEALEACVGNTNILLNCKDSWKWLLAENGIFSVKALTKLIEEKCIDFGNNTGETIWNKLIPKKVNIFMRG
ncbi:hypothetical protein Tco_0018470 [Tanacetum coccineum]